MNEPPTMSGGIRPGVATYWLVVVAAYVVAGAMLVGFTPLEPSMGVVQRIFYLHLPVALCTFLACFVVCLASAAYLWTRRPRWDDLAESAGAVAALLCGILLLTGMTWARAAWGQWWTWSPRLTFSLALFVLYVVYVMLRPAIAPASRRAMICALYGVVAFLDVPIVYFSTRLMPDLHPTRMPLSPAMQATLLAWFVAITLTTVGLIAAGWENARTRRRLARGAGEDDLDAIASEATR